MLRAKHELAEILAHRINQSGRSAEVYFERASEVIVFGSMAAGLDTLSSDIDVLCVGGQPAKAKTPALDLLVVSQETSRSSVWLQSELTSHISRYGVWIKGTPEWQERAEIGARVVEAKRRRVGAFMRCLPAKWSELEEGFRIKYAVKVRREAQRLHLLQRGVPVPPTRMLDTCSGVAAESVYEVYESLVRLSRQVERGFTTEFLSYVVESWRGTRLLNARGTLRGFGSVGTFGRRAHLPTIMVLDS